MGGDGVPRTTMGTATASVPTGLPPIDPTVGSAAATQSAMPTLIHLPPRRTLVPWLVGVLVVGGVLLIAWFFREALTLAFIAFGVAYALSPVVRWAERFRIPRPITILLVMSAGGTVFTASAWVLVRELFTQGEALVRSVPRYSLHIQREWFPWLREHWHLRIPPRTEDALRELGVNASNIAPRISGWLNESLKYTPVLIEYVFKVLVVFALAFYFLLDFDGFIHRTNDLVPHRARDRVRRLARETDESLRHFVNGQLLVMVILGGLFALGLGLLGIPAWWVIGLFAGMVSFVPYLGFFVAFGVALFMAALQGKGFAHVFAVGGVMAAVHVLDLTLITPRILGSRTKISPVMIILSLIAGGTVFGFVGVFVAIPVASVLRVLLRELVDHYKSTAFFLTRGGTSLPSLGNITTVPTTLQPELASVLFSGNNALITGSFPAIATGSTPPATASTPAAAATTTTIATRSTPPPPRSSGETTEPGPAAIYAPPDATTTTAATGRDPTESSG
jgi:predicted PurR-regulated permease PerM